jgi:hypothetical protein
VGPFQSVFLPLNQIIVDELSSFLDIRLGLFSFFDHPFDFFDVLNREIIKVVSEKVLNWRNGYFDVGKVQFEPCVIAHDLIKDEIHVLHASELIRFIASRIRYLLIVF